MKKICKKCGIEKTSDEFYLRENRKDNLSYFCIECCKLYAKEYVSNNQEKIKQ